jgi:hypothetical protein
MMVLHVSSAGFYGSLSGLHGRHLAPTHEVGFFATIGVMEVVVNNSGWNGTSLMRK